MSVPKVAAVIGAGGHRDRPDHARPHSLASGTPLGGTPLGGTRSLGGTLLGGTRSLGGIPLGGAPHLRHLVVVYTRRALSEAFAVAAS
jgi:hypothetical protein